MKPSFLALVILFCCATGIANAQINAITSDGKKVLLFDDGTWKYVYETDGKKVILNPDGTWRFEGDSTEKTEAGKPPVPEPIVAPVITPVPVPVKALKGDSLTAVVPADSTTELPPAPKPKPKPPLNLECSALVGIQREQGGDKFNAIAKDILVSADGKTGFTITFHKTKNTPLTWITRIMGPGQCVDTENKIYISFKGGAHLQILNDGKANCNGEFRLLFGGVGGKEEIFEVLQTTEVAAIRIYTVKGYAEQTFDEEAALRFKAAINCMPK